MGDTTIFITQQIIIIYTCAHNAFDHDKKNYATRFAFVIVNYIVQWTNVKKFTRNGGLCHHFFRIDIRKYVIDKI